MYSDDVTFGVGYANNWAAQEFSVNHSFSNVEIHYDNSPSSLYCSQSSFSETATTIAVWATAIAFFAGRAALIIFGQIIATPFIAIPKVIALNYTLFQHHPRSFARAALMANLLFWKGFLFENIIKPHIDSEHCTQYFNTRAQHAYARMLLYATRGHVDPELEDLFAEREISFPSCSNPHLDLAAMNTIAPILNEPSAELIEEFTEQNFIHLALKREYFQNRVENVEIPPLPPGTSLRASYAKLWSYIGPTWPDQLQINDDNQMRSKNELRNNTFNRLIDLDQNRIENDANPTAESIQTIKNALGHVALNFLARKKIIDALQEGSQKDKALRTWLLEGRAFFMSASTMFYHCIDRKLTDSIIFYQRYVQRKPSSPDAINNLRLETQVATILQEYRQDLIQYACTNLIETNGHHVSTERFVKNALNRELGLGLPQTLGARDALQRLAIRSKEMEVRDLFYRLYTPQAIVRHFIKKTTALMKEESHQQLYMKIVEWFERQDPPRTAADIFDPDTLSFKEAAIIELFKKLEIIRQ
jgi:hypothetical protein